MPALSLLIGNKNYSSWSLRPWLLLKQTGLAFEEVRVPLYTPEFAARVREYSPAGKVPALRHGAIAVWDSLAICEYVNETFPELRAWPRAADERAVARAISAEMHSGFQALRRQMPVNVRASGRRVKSTPDLEADIARVREIWRECRERNAARGPFLFGDFSIADAMYAPVAFRFATYGVALGPPEAAYVESLRRLPAMAEWAASAAAEVEVEERYEVGR
jgi:glutathione S-transferase